MILVRNKYLIGWRNKNTIRLNIGSIRITARTFGSECELGIRNNTANAPDLGAPFGQMQLHILPRVAC